ncbi:hypothetical protein CRN84_20640 [Budvicia aquatica]|uniref:Uncharacterized protein n=1 Tax=Budvicia aquatica TaxID=82979 RepID=A0A2C6DRX8_9GAMM|nr:hypothetical protein CRN84_05370 [Budvicia aquatica]PHI31571.1 hypothetical protein CRN84_20640 [Budvicia aquatica]
MLFLDLSILTYRRVDLDIIMIIPIAVNKPNGMPTNGVASALVNPATAPNPRTGASIFIIMMMTTPPTLDLCNTMTMATKNIAAINNIYSSLKKLNALQKMKLNNEDSLFSRTFW